MKLHPITKLFPPLCQEEFDVLVQDIRDRGVLVPVTTFEGRVIDGRHRLKACEKLGIEPPVQEWKPKGGESVVGHVVALNLFRRQLDNDQKAILGNAIRKELKREAESRMKAGTLPSKDGRVGTAAEIGAKLAGTSASSVERAAKLERDDPEGYERVVKGEMTIAKARKSGPPPAKKKSGPPPARTKFDKAIAQSGPVKRAIQMVRALKKHVNDEVEAPFKAHLDIGQIDADLTNLRRELEQGVPYSSCLLCGGRRTCKACRGTGWLNKLVHDHVRKRAKDGAVVSPELDVLEQAIADQEPIRRLANMTTQMARIFNGLKNTGAAAGINTQEIEQGIGRLGHRFRNGLAYTVCPSCQGSKCRDCRQQGWVTEESFNNSGLDDFEREEHHAKYPRASWKAD